MSSRREEEEWKTCTGGAPAPQTVILCKLWLCMSLVFWVIGFILVGVLRSYHEIDRNLVQSPSGCVLAGYYVDADARCPKSNVEKFFLSDKHDSGSKSCIKGFGVYNYSLVENPTVLTHTHRFEEGHFDPDDWSVAQVYAALATPEYHGGAIGATNRTCFYDKRNPDDMWMEGGMGPFWKFQKKQYGVLFGIGAAMVALFLYAMFDPKYCTRAFWWDVRRNWQFHYDAWLERRRDARARRDVQLGRREEERGKEEAPESDEAKARRLEAEWRYQNYQRTQKGQPAMSWERFAAKKGLNKKKKQQQTEGAAAAPAGAAAASPASPSSAAPSSPLSAAAATGASTELTAIVTAAPASDSAAAAAAAATPAAAAAVEPVAVADIALSMPAPEELPYHQDRTETYNGVIGDAKR